MMRLDRAGKVTLLAAVAILAWLLLSSLFW